MGPGSATAVARIHDDYPCHHIQRLPVAVGSCGYRQEDEESMRYSIPGLGGRLRRARNGTGLSQEKVADRIGVSWMTVHRWERSQRAIPEHLLDKVCELYDRPLRWFLTLEEGDLEEETGPVGKEPSTAANNLYRMIADAPDGYRPMIEKVVVDLLDSMKQSGFR